MFCTHSISDYEREVFMSRTIIHVKERNKLVTQTTLARREKNISLLPESQIKSA